MKIAFLALVAGLAVPSFAEEKLSEFDALVKSYDESEKKTVDKFEEFKPQFLALADRLEGDAALEARLWVLGKLSYERRAGTMEESAEALSAKILRLHKDSAGLDKIASYYYVFSPDQRQKIIVSLLESKHATVQAAAVFAMARLERKDQDRRASHFRLLIEKYGDLAYKDTTYGEIADANLNPHPKEALQIGKVAPDIVATDGEGNPIKLSDYRGKVVVIDFWGDW